MMNLFDMTKKDLQDFLVAQGMKKIPGRSDFSLYI